MNCPVKTCRLEIDDDSVFCDQCGAEVLVCPKCKSYAAGKFCPKDGHRLESRKKTQEAPAIPHTSPDKVPQPAPLQTPPSSSTMRFSPQPVTAETITFKHISGKEIITKSNDILGRREGPHAGSLVEYQFISSRHAQIISVGNQWFIRDLGSTNGTTVNGGKIEKDKDIPIKAGSVITLADQQFTVS